MRSNFIKIGITLTIVGLLAGCGVPATPLDTIKPPLSEPNLHNDTASQKIIELLPHKVQLVAPIMGEAEDAVSFGDMNGDGIDEAIVVFENDKKRGNSLKAILFQKENEAWKKITEINGFGYGLNYTEFSDIDNDGHNELLLGWSLGEAGNGLDVYKLKEDQLHLFSKKVYSEQFDLEK
ncbi:FG-GAP repeat domain-containing protein [Paenibacillus sp. NPDC058071]|uniref:FG-GAP repeat domain-containing protein n=1 Tax=Paenibacillus sp. NPDC058071 TaxID=3346326 RepID=UPI0036D93CB9